MKIEKKLAVLIGDGMADYPVEALGNRTPLEYAKTPHMDYLASRGLFGLVKTVPDGMAPGSDTANLSIFGYDPARYYTGRAPLEALNMGISMGPGDVAFRCNLVNIDGSGVMVDFSAGHIETPFTGVVIGELRKKVEGGGIELFAGVSYRNILIWRDYPHGEITETTPPHDIQGREIRSHLPKGCGADKLNEIMDLSRKVISGSEAIREGKSRYRGDPTSAWLWGGGWRPAMESLTDRYGLRGHTIAAVDLIHGIGRAAGLTPIDVPGATGYIDTNYEGKADALIDAFRDASFVFLHVEAPDESGHEGNLEHKIQAIEDFDARVVGRVMEKMKKYEDYTILVMPDHPTPLSLRTHTADPVPFCIYSSRKAGPAAGGVSGYNEREASRTGVFVMEGHRLIEIMIKGGL